LRKPGLSVLTVPPTRPEQLPTVWTGTHVPASACHPSNDRALAPSTIWTAACAFVEARYVRASRTINQHPKRRNTQGGQNWTPIGGQFWKPIDKQSGPLVEEFFAWCLTYPAHALDESPLHRAIGYALNQRAALTRFVADERLPMHNNVSERMLRRQAVGR